jgi:hypothetical protein
MAPRLRYNITIHHGWVASVEHIEKYCGPLRDRYRGSINLRLFRHFSFDNVTRLNILRMVGQFKSTHWLSTIFRLLVWNLSPHCVLQKQNHVLRNKENSVWRIDISGALQSYTTMQNTPLVNKYKHCCNSMNSQQVYNARVAFSIKWVHTIV